MNNSKLTPAQVKEKYGYAVPRMLKSVMDLGKWIDEVETRLISEGDLKILKNGKYRWLKKQKAQTP